LGEAADPIISWQHIHGASTHFPIALLAVSLFFDLGALAFRQTGWRTAAFYTLILGTIAAIPACLSGLTGGNGWFGNDAWTSGPINNHRLISLIASGVALLLTLWRCLRRDKLERGELVVYLIIMAFVVAGVGYAGWLGAYVAGIY
jgi:uncharacterized membrane protein